MTEKNFCGLDRAEISLKWNLGKPKCFNDQECEIWNSKWDWTGNENQIPSQCGINKNTKE